MIARSSNLATNLLIQLADAEKTTALMHRLGARDILVRRGVEDLKAFERDLNNESSAAAMLAVMTACAQSDHFSPESRQEMWRILRQQAYNDMIPAGLPPNSGAVVAHKTGSISRVQHDAAIVELPDGHRYVLIVFARDFGTEAGRAQVKTTAAQISRHIYDHVTAKTR
jgi:beta-lactamase class A